MAWSAASTARDSRDDGGVFERVEREADTDRDTERTEEIEGARESGIEGAMIAIVWRRGLFAREYSKARKAQIDYCYPLLLVCLFVFSDVSYGLWRNCMINTVIGGF